MSILSYQIEVMENLQIGQSSEIFKNETLFTTISRIKQGFILTKLEMKYVRVGFLKFERKWQIVSEVFIPVTS